MDNEKEETEYSHPSAKEYQSQSMAQFRMQKQLQGLLGFSAMVVPSRWRPLMPRLLEVLLVLPIRNFQTPNLIGNANGKGSQISRSLRTIGKLINGSEKRNQQNLMESRHPSKVLLMSSVPSHQC
ncbi:hypothetical protein ACB098_09G173800 [Castanea mollissima]